MINIQEEHKLLEAVRYITANPTLSFHHVSVKFGVDVSKLQNSWAESRRKQPIPQNEKEL